MLNLDALSQAAKFPRVQLCGREHAVKPLTGFAAHKIAAVQSVQDNGEAMLAALLDVVRQSVPTLTAAEVDGLTIEQVAAVVQLCRGQVAEVEAQLAESAEKN